MDKEIFNSIKTGLKEAIALEKGTLAGVKKRKVSIEPIPHYRAKEIKQIREHLRLTQTSFALVLGVSIKTVEAWESGKNIPQGPAQRMLDIMKKEDNFLAKYKIVEYAS